MDDEPYPIIDELQFTWNESWQRLIWELIHAWGKEQ